jgi:hypothetical protein
MDSTNTVATFTPASALAAGTTYTATISGAKDTFGQTMTPYSYTFTTSKAFPPGCPCAIWPDSTPSGSSDSGDGTQVEVGLRFQAAGDGTITGIRFYKEPANAGTHTGTLWTSTGTVLATGTFSSESSQGWQELDFATPVAVTAGTTYVASYHTTTGHYAVSSGGLASPVTSGPLTALASGGVYAYGASTFPSNTYNAANYWVDVVYKPSPDVNPPAVTATTPSNVATSVPVSSQVTIKFNKSIKPGSATFSLTGPGGTAVSGTTALDGSGTLLTFSPSSPLSASATYSASVNGATNTSGVAMTTAYTWSFVTSGLAACPCTTFESDATPGTAAVNESSAVELGMKFTPTANGWISGIRFYKGPGNTGTHLGNLWTDVGGLLASGTFSNETATGWQTLEFPTAVQVNAGQTYVASYYAPNGHYSVTSGYFSSSGVSNPPLAALKDGVDGGNGLYAYGIDQFPAGSFGSSNYWVDPIFWATQPPDLVPPAISSTNPLNGQTSVPTSTGVSFTFDKAVQSGTIQFALTGPGNVSVPGTLSYNAATNTSTFLPSGSLLGGSGPLAPGTTYTATASGATDSGGLPMTSPYTWSFTTAQASSSQCPCSIWSDSAQPSVASENDPGAITLGVKFTTDQSGWITGIRFYKGSGNTGTHVGSLWDANGNLLGQVTFSGESTAGWQQATFATPVAVTANTTYIASYFAPNGHYAADGAAFASAGVDNAPLHALPSGSSGGNGVYAYGGAPTFPANSYNATNYWVDVVFNTTP